MTASRLIVAGLFVVAAMGSAYAQTPQQAQQQHIQARGREPIVHADVVALDQLLIYNRFGSFNPFGMVFALRRDVSNIENPAGIGPIADACGMRDGTEAGVGALDAGQVRLKDCTRPRPLVLRGNVGEILEVTVTNLLANRQPGFSDTF